MLGRVGRLKAELHQSDDTVARLDEVLPQLDTLSMRSAVGDSDRGELTQPAYFWRSSLMRPTLPSKFWNLQAGP